MKESDSYSILQRDKSLKYIFLLFFAAVIAGLLYIFRFFFWDFLFALLLYMALRPLHDALLKRIRMRGVTAGLMTLLLCLLVLGPLFYFTLALVDQVFQLYATVEGLIRKGILDDIYNMAFVRRVLEYLNLNKETIIAKATDFVQGGIGTAFTSAKNVITYPLSFSINFFLVLLIIYFLFKDGHRLVPIVYKVLPFPDDLERGVVDRLNEVVKVLLAGNLLIMLCQGLMVGLGLLFTGINVALLGGSLAAILSLIPVVGTSVVWLPAVLYLCLVGDYGKAAFLGSWCMGWYLLLENLVKPKLFGKKLNFHPIVFFFLLLGSIQAFSIPGVIIGPILLTLFYSLWEIYNLLKEYDRYQYEQEGTVPPGSDSE